MNQAIKELSQYLAEVIPSSNIPRLLDFSGISPANLDLSGTAINVWYGIVKQGHEEGKLTELIQVIQEDYQQGPVFDRLGELLSSYQATPPAQPSTGNGPRVSQTPQQEIQAIRMSFLDSIDDLELAVEQMLGLTRQIENLKRMENDVIALSGRIGSLQRQADKGTLPAHEVTRQTNVLREALLGTLDRLERRLRI